MFIDVRQLQNVRICDKKKVYGILSTLRLNRSVDHRLSK
jgi:hypothetical protein